MNSAEPQTPLEDLTFHGSGGPSIGVELEFQLLERESGDLAPGAVRILGALDEQDSEHVDAELMQSMIEIKTDVCTNVAEARSQLVPRVRRVQNIASSLGYDLAMGGTHPFSRTTTSAVFPDARYGRIEEKMAGVTYQIVVFGLHVHVGVPSGDVAMSITNMLVQYLPHLLALSANSPAWQGVDTGLMSYRSAQFGLVPRYGVPHYFANWKDFCQYVEVMRDCQAIRNTKDIHWDIRSRPQTGTVEFRVCDMPASLSQVFALVALVRCLVVGAQRLLEEKPNLRQGDLRRYWIAPENKWLAARYGLQAQCIRTPGGKRQTLGAEVAGLVERVATIAEEFGDETFFAPLRALDQYETGAQRQRRIYRDAGNWKAVTDDQRSRLVQELDEATAQTSAIGAAL